MKSRFKLFLLASIFISSCAPATPTNTITVLPSPTIKIEPPTPTPTATPAPISLPVNRFSPIPALLPLTTENIKDIKEVAFFDNSPISTYITDDKSKLAVWFISGIQTYNLPALSPNPFIRLNMSYFSESDAISEDGKFFARAYPGLNAEVWIPTIFIWDTETGEKVCEIKLSERKGNSFYTSFHLEQNTFSIHGELGNNGKHKVIIYGLHTCQKIFDRDSDSGISSISPDGKYAAVTQNGQVVIYDTKTKNKTSIGETSGARGVGFLQDSGEVAISYTGRTLIYDMFNGEVNEVFDASVANFYSKISSINHGEWVAVLASDKNSFWNSSENQVYAFKDFTGNNFTFNNGILKTYKAIFNLRTKAKIDIEKYGYQATTTLSLDQNYFAISSNIPPFITDVYETSTGKKINSITGVYSPIAISPDSFIASSNEGSKIFGFITGESIQTINSSYIGGLHINNEETVIWDALGKISLINTNTGKVIADSNLPVFPLSSLNYTRYRNATPIWAEIPQASFANMLPSNVMVSNDRTIGIQENEDKVQIFSILNGNFIPTDEQQIATYNLTNLGFQYKFSPDGSIIAGANFYSLTLWDSQTGVRIERIGLPNGMVTDMQFSSDGTKLVISKNDGPPQVNVFGNLTLTIFDVIEKKIIQDYKLDQQLRKTGCNATLPIALTSDGNQIVTLTQDCNIGIYDTYTFDELRVFRSSYKDAAIALALSPDDSILAIVTQKRLELWDMKTGTKINKFDIPELAGTFDNYSHKVVFSPDGKTIIVNSIFFGQSSVTTFWGVPETP